MGTESEGLLMRLPKCDATGGATESSSSMVMMAECFVEGSGVTLECWAWPITPDCSLHDQVM